MAISSVNIHGLSFFKGLASCHIFVAVLVRPLNQTEQASEVEVAWDWSERSVLARGNNWKVEGESNSEHFWQDIDEEDYVADPIDEINSNNFSLERVFGPTSTAREVYDVGAKNIVLSVLDGINGAVFAYGQTGSGKTFTLSKIAENAICDIYEHIENRPERRFFLKFSAFEIYNETVMDLMKQKQGSLPDIDDPKQEGITVENLGEVAVKSIQHLRSLIKSCKAPSQTSDRNSRSTRIIRLIDQHNNATEVETQLPSREHASSDLRCESLLNVKKLRIQKMKKQLKKVKRQRDSLLKDLKEVERHRDLEMMKVMKKLKEVERQDLQILKVMKELKKGHDLGSELSNIMFKLGLVQRQGKQLMRSSRAKGSLQVSPTEGTHEVVA